MLFHSDSSLFWMQQFKQVISRRRQVIGAQCCPTSNPRENNLPFLIFFNTFKGGTRKRNPGPICGTLPGAAAAPAPRQQRLVLLEKQIVRPPHPRAGARCVDVGQEPRAVFGRLCWETRTREANVGARVSAVQQTLFGFLSGSYSSGGA